MLTTTYINEKKKEIKETIKLMEAVGTGYADEYIAHLMRRLSAYNHEYRDALIREYQEEE